MAVAGAQPAGTASWAAVAVAEPAKKAQGPAAEAVSTKTTAVIDTNAIMSGVALGSLAERLVTIPEVLEEVRDVRTRERLAALHIALETLEPTEEAMAAGPARCSCLQMKSDGGWQWRPPTSTA